MFMFLLGWLKKPRPAVGESRLQPTREGARSTLADGERIDPADRHDFHAGIGQEALIRALKIGDMIMPFPDR